jgi:hypothetical protein
MRKQLPEISKETLDRLCAAINAKKPDIKKIRKGNRKRLDEVLLAVDSCLSSANGLCMSFGEITDLHSYVCNLESMADWEYEHFIETVEKQEVEQYKDILDGRDNLKKTLYHLMFTIETTHRS